MVFRIMKLGYIATAEEVIYLIKYLSGMLNVANFFQQILANMLISLIFQNQKF